eukprot:jgi/Tetstr1/439963/TSEL_003029.t1
MGIEAGAVLDRDRSGVGDLTLETSGLTADEADRSRPSDLTLAGWGMPACDYVIDFACVSSTIDSYLGQRPPLVLPGDHGDRGGPQQTGGGPCFFRRG